MQNTKRDMQNMLKHAKNMQKYAGKFVRKYAVCKIAKKYAEYAKK